MFASVGVSVLLVQLYKQSTASEIGRAETSLASACEAIQIRYAFYVKDWDGAGISFDNASSSGDLKAVVADALFDTPTIGGGIWQSDADIVAYVGAEPISLLPEADRATIARISAEVIDSGLRSRANIESATGRTLFAACPLKGPLAGLSAWTRLEVKTGLGFVRLRLGLALLLLLVLGMSAWLSWLVILWSRHIARIEAALGGYQGDAMPMLTRTGELELDRIVDALNDAGRKLAEGRLHSDQLARRVASAERLAALGRVAAGVAHEIRNPLASMQLKAENALAGDDERRCKALSGMLGQIARLNKLVTELLEFAQPRTPQPAILDLSEFLVSRSEEHREAAEAAGVSIVTRSEIGQARFDPDLVMRIVDNLIGNAIRHPGVVISIDAKLENGMMRITVADTGPGIDPAIRDSLFDPFVTHRPDGTGLGLAISREIAELHGGRLTLLRAGGEGPGDGAVFLLELPWQQF